MLLDNSLRIIVKIMMQEKKMISELMRSCKLIDVMFIYFNANYCFKVIDGLVRIILMMLSEELDLTIFLIN
jgi:hypothetical protein